MGARHWSSNLLFLIIAIGTEAGIANVWKFSYLAGANGGGLFVALYFLALFLIAIPALMAEMLIGRHGGKSVVGTMNVLVTRDAIAPFWKSFGALATASVILILSYYFVICGWMLDYFFFGLRGGFKEIDSSGAASAFQQMLSSPARMLLFSGIIIATTAVVIARGINKGIERVSGVLTPLRFVILFVLLIYSAIFADFGRAASFLFSVDWSKFSAGVVVTAFGQAFFSLGIGVGVMMMMGAYMKREYSITRAVFTVAVAQGLVALIAGMSIFPLVFTYGLEPTQGPGLIFVTLPVAFGQMPYGQIFGTLLFLLLSFAALTATIVIQEPIVAALEEYTTWSRPALAYSTGLVIWLMGFVTVLSFNHWSDVHPLRWLGVESTRTPFELLDYLTSNLMMPLGGLMVALIAGWALSRAAVRDELGLGDGTGFKLWYAATRYLVPVAILVIFYSVL
ncbi:sodium-dependent transporter [Peristeroidobacter agariperforans]|uniref:sodium-dependent transporter n=1 Tax=Peristeroidobacter agariperforans TaxID=268404 RepID=UPI00101BA841|nr:sodium-dependent transporter [Peristeroidobacter agariperforans]